MRSRECVFAWGHVRFVCVDHFQEGAQTTRVFSRGQAGLRLRVKYPLPSTRPRLCVRIAKVQEPFRNAPPIWEGGHELLLFYSLWSLKEKIVRIIRTRLIFFFHFICIFVTAGVKIRVF